MTTLSCYIDGIGLLGPAMNDWTASLPLMIGQLPYEYRKTVLPSPACLPPNERRRCGPIVKLTLAVGQEAASAAGREPSGLPTVFSASGGDGNNCHELCEMLATDDRQISPTRFHNSVHNAAAGYWSIAMRAMTPSSVLCAHDASFGAGLLEAMSQTVADRTSVLLIACDTTYPEPLRTARPIPDDFGVALVLSPSRSAASIAMITVALTPEPADTLHDPALERLRAGVPAARSLPMLQAIAAMRPGSVVLDYHDSQNLAVGVTPCC